MAHVANVVPSETDLICEGCAYLLNELPLDSRCPECGKPIAESIGSHRGPPAFERAGKVGEPTAFIGFFATLAAVVFQPTFFYRTLETRGCSPRARLFALVMWAAVSIMMGFSVYAHEDWFAHLGSAHRASPLLIPGVTLLVFFLLWFTTLIATRLTTWEAAYRGYRLPAASVLRALYYHSAHYLPVALLTAATMIGYYELQTHGYFSPESSTIYLYTLSAEVIAGAAYLFVTYWIGMRNMMYANK